MTSFGVLVCAGATAVAVMLAAPPLPGRSSVEATRRTSLVARRSDVRGRTAEPERAGPARFRGPAAVLGGGLILVLLGGWLGALAAPAAAFGLWRFVGGMEPPAARRRREALAADLPLVVNLLSAALAVGASPSSAVRVVADAVDPPAREELHAVARRLSLGVDPVRVWAEVGGHPQLGPLGRCMVRALEAGASVAAAMLLLADDLRDTARMETEGRARSVGVKAAAPLGVCLLPAFVLTGVVPLVAGSVMTLLGR